MTVPAVADLHVDRAAVSGSLHGAWDRRVRMVPLVPLAALLPAWSHLVFPVRLPLLGRKEKERMAHLSRATDRPSRMP